MKRKEIISEINLGNYVKKATQSKALSQMDKAFGYPGDHDRKIANREKGLMRAKRRGDAKLAAMRSKEAPKANPSELKARLDKLKSEFDPYYDYSDDHSVWTKHRNIEKEIRSIEQQLKSLDEASGPDAELKRYLMKDVNDKVANLNQIYIKAKKMGDMEMMGKVKTALAKISAKKSKLASELGISEDELDEMTTGQPQQGQVTGVDPVKKLATVKTPTGDTQVPLDKITANPNKPGEKVAQVDPADPVKPGEKISVQQVSEMGDQVSPRFAGLQKTKHADGSTTTDYQAGPMHSTQKVDAQGRPVKSIAQYDLGVGKIGAEQDHASGITTKTATPADPNADPNQLMPTSAVAAAKGVDPKKFAAFQKQNTAAVRENSEVTALKKLAGL